MSWIILFLAGLFEVCWAVGLKYTDGFTRPLPTLLTIAAMIVSIGLLGLAMKELPLGTAYAIWTGVGAVGTVIAGIFLFGESMALLRLGSVALIVVGLLLYAWLSRRKAAVLGSVAEHPASTRAANGSGSHRAVAAARQSDAAAAPGAESASEPWRGARINRLPDLDRADRTAAAAEPEPDSAELGEQADPSGDVRLQAFVETRAADPSRQPVRG